MIEMTTCHDAELLVFMSSKTNHALRAAAREEMWARQDAGTWRGNNDDTRNED